LAIVRQARTAASKALQSLRAEIKATTARLQELVEEERQFRSELFGAVRERLGMAGGVRRGRPPGRPPGRPAGRRVAARPRRKGPPKADRYFSQLGNSFTLDDVRKLAGRAAGISLAQWSRAKRIKKTGKGYQKLAS
jgi:hypothetical protein